ncbi:MAG: FHA domain-containing protein [Armatimonadetes bacterium]|nr:FHA domain-containing protein [Armatimonadota bacterium]
MSETPTPGSSTATQPSDVKDDRGPDSRRDDRRSVEREAASAPNPLVSLLNLVIGLAVVGGLGYAVFTYYKKNTKQVDDALKKFGIGEQPPQDQTPAPPVPQQPQPLKPIVLDAAVPTAAVTPMATTTMVAANPRLVRPDGSVVLLQEGATTVGRDDGLGLSLIGESSVSRQHARFDRAGDSVRLTDLGSTNGTFVNGSRLQGETALSVGDSVQFGAVAFRFEA